MTPVSDAKNTIFITGATGFLGSYLLKIFLENDHKVFVLARSKNGINTRARIVQTLKFWDNNLIKKIHNLTIVNGDIRLKNLGIGSTIAHKLLNQVDEIFHTAAIIELHTPLKDIYAVNVRGTRNVLDLALEWHKHGRLQKVNHISTAYVYGDYTKSFTETDLDKGQHFNTNYERTKFEAEKLVRRYRKTGLWIDVFRPPMILGESKTGKTFQFLHVYQFLKLCKLELFDSLPLADGFVSIVPVDIAAQAIYRLDLKCRKKNLTYHCFPAKLNSIKEMVTIGAKVLGYRTPKAVPMADFSRLNLTPVQRMLLSRNLTSMNFKVKLNSNRTNTMLRRIGFTIPTIGTQTLIVMLKYAAFLQD